jgi:hypothetical protein
MPHSSPNQEFLAVAKVAKNQLKAALFPPQIFFRSARLEVA